MKISRDNPEFDNYDIFVVEESIEPKFFLGIKTHYGLTRKEVKIKNAMEADDETGFIVQHLTDDNGNLIYTNDSDEIVIDNTVKFLMLNPQLRTAFLASGFRPKLTSRYEKSLRIVKREGSLQKPSEARETLDLNNDRVQFDAI